MRLSDQPPLPVLDAAGCIAYMCGCPSPPNSKRAMTNKVLDARNLNCPLPILKTKRALGEVSVGGTLEVLATDPGSPDDFLAFADSTGHTLVEHSEDGTGVFRFLLRRKA